MHKNFSFKGTVRSNDNILASEGECMEIVNMRMLNGSLRPVPEVREVAVLPGTYRNIYRHDKTSCYLCVDEEGCWGVDFYDSNWNPLLDEKGNKLNFPLLEDVREIEFVGYVAICMTSNGIQYLLYHNNRYRFLGNRPEIPGLSIKLSSKVHELVSESSYTKSHTDVDISSTWLYNARGLFDECIAKANKEGYYIDRALFRFALKLYDGSYIYCSHVIYAAYDHEVGGLSRDSENLVATPVVDNTNNSVYSIKVLGFTPTFIFSNLNLEDWEGVIIGIDVFTTGSIMGKKIGMSSMTINDTQTKKSVKEKFEAYKDKELNELWNEINDASLFYKVAEFDIHGNCLNRVTDVSMSNLVIQDALSSFDMNPTLSTIVPDCSYMFNNRLHVASLREDFFKGYNAKSIVPTNVSTVYSNDVVVKTLINTQNGVSVVVNRFEYAELGYRYGELELPPLLTYPDTRAFEMHVYVCYNSGIRMKKFPLTPHKILNQAQYLHKWYIGFVVKITPYFKNGGSVAYISKEDVLKVFKSVVGPHEIVYSQNTNGWEYRGESFPPKEYSSHRAFAVPAYAVDGDKIVFDIRRGVENTYFRDINNIPVDETWTVVENFDDCNEVRPYEFKENVIKVSMVDNPFVFPAKCTYSLSQCRVVALSTNRHLLSEGQFGEHPLYVFTNDGIYVMAVDTSGTVAYSNILPVSHDVCLYPNTVCGTDSGVVFLGQHGVMMICGNKCISLSAPLNDDGKELKVFEHSDIIEQIASIRGMEYVVATGEFLRYMYNARCVRFPEMNEILFCNSDYRFCFVYSISEKIWSKLSRPFWGNVKNSVGFLLFSHNGSKTSILQQDNSVVGKNDVFLITRPQPFGTKLPKRIMQLMLHAYLSKPSDIVKGMPFFSCFLLCSNDGVCFKIVSGCERREDAQDVVFPYFPTSSYKYFMFAFVGRLNTDSMITGLEFELSFAWNNRLR